MIRIFKVVVLLLFSFFVSCKKDDGGTVSIPPIPYAEQYPVDKAAIDKFLDEYSMEVSANNDVTFTKLGATNPNTTSIRLQTQYPLQDTIVKSNDIDYKLYFMKFAKGTKERPTRVDSVYVSYKGRLLDNTTFDQAQNPVWFPLDIVVNGWKEIMPLFKTGDHTIGSDGAVTYSGYGAGVMFLPSAYGYYNNAAGTIPSYSPLIFSFKLNKLNYIDHDYDRIDSRFEDINGNGTFSDDDTDGDGVPNYADADDDGDGFLTKFEIKNPAGGYFDYANIPLCAGDNNKKVHLTKACKPN
jgi:FKBP-type peptidyl-prolyl cis-trans isomerase FkpA